jgi:hypothetical protein
MMKAAAQKQWHLGSKSWPMYTSVHHRELLMDGIASLLHTSQNNDAPMAVEKIISNPKRSQHCHSSNSSTETGG